MGYTNPSGWEKISFYAKVSFFENLMKNLIAAGVLRINIWFSVPVPKIKFDPPPQGKNALGAHILSPSLNRQFFPDMEISSKS